MRSKVSAMAELRIENPGTTEAFAAALAAVDVKLPVGPSPDDLGSVLDADGREVLVIDVNREKPDAQVEVIRLWIVLAVNTCGGFRAVRRHG